MAKGTSGARKVRKIRDSRDGWKERAGTKQKEIKRLRGTVRDLIVSRERWKERVEALERQVEVLQQNVAIPSYVFLVFGG